MDVGGSLIVGTPTAAGTLTLGGLVLEYNAAATFNLTSVATVGQGVNSFIQDNGSLAFGGNNTLYINPLALLANNSTYTLIACSGFTGSLPTASTVSASIYTFSVNSVVTASNTLIQVTVTGGTPSLLVWNNASDDGEWDVQNSANWSNVTTQASPVDFYSFDPVVFDDSITSSPYPTTSIDIASGQVVIPTVMTNNSVANNYTISGAGKISGLASIVKLGGSTLTISTTNDFTGSVLIAGGTLKAGPSTSLGATAGTVYVTNGATLDFDYALGAKPLVISGAGVNGLGALVNNDPSGTPVYDSGVGVLNVTQAGNATIGGTNRVDFGKRSPAFGTWSSGGSNYSLTFVGYTYRELDNVAFDTNFGNINVNTTNSPGYGLGILGVTALGNPANNLAVFSNASVALWDDVTNVTINKNIILSGSATLQNAGGSNTILSPITLGIRWQAIPTLSVKRRCWVRAARWN